MEALVAIGVVLLILGSIGCVLFFFFGAVDRMQGRSSAHARWVAQTLPPIMWHAWFMGYGIIELIAKRVDFTERKRSRIDRRIEAMEKLEERN